MDITSLNSMRHLVSLQHLPRPLASSGTSLLFEVCSAAEVFQRAMSNVVADIPGTLYTSDDILIHGPNREAHDRTLQATLQCLEQTGLAVNSKKCSSHHPKLEFFGFVFGSEGLGFTQKSGDHSEGTNPRVCRRTEEFSWVCDILFSLCIKLCHSLHTTSKFA